MSKLNRLLTGMLLAVFVMGMAMGQTELIGEDFSSAPVDWINGSIYPTTTGGELYYAEEKKNARSIVTIAVTDPDYITFDHKKGANGYSGAFTVKYSTSQSGTFSSVWVTVTPASTSYVPSGTAFPGAAGTYYLQLERASGNKDLYIDNFFVTQSIVPSTTSLSGFAYELSGGPSAEQSFTVSGADLTANITITPPTNYEISTGTGAGFSAGNPITLTQSSGTVSSTTIYVRLKSGLSETSYNNETINISSTGKNSKTVTCSGFVGSLILNTKIYIEGALW